MAGHSVAGRGEGSRVGFGGVKRFNTWPGDGAAFAWVLGVWIVGAAVIALLPARYGNPPLDAQLLWTGTAPIMLMGSVFSGLLMQREMVVWLLGGVCLSVLLLAGALLVVAFCRRSRSVLDLGIALMPIGQAITLRWFTTYWWGIGI